MLILHRQSGQPGYDGLIDLNGRLYKIQAFQNCLRGYSGLFHQDKYVLAPTTGFFKLNSWLGGK